MPCTPAPAPAGTSPRREKITTSTRHARTTNTVETQVSVGTPGGRPDSVRATATIATNLAADIGVDEGDVDVRLDLLDEGSPVLSDELAAFLRRVLDRTVSAPCCQRSTGQRQIDGRVGRTGSAARTPPPDASRR